LSEAHSPSFLPCWMYFYHYSLAERERERERKRERERGKQREREKDRQRETEREREREKERERERKRKKERLLPYSICISMCVRVGVCRGVTSYDFIFLCRNMNEAHPSSVLPCWTDFYHYTESESERECV